MRPRRLAVAFLVLLIIAVGALAISPDLRTAVAKRLGIHGIEIIFVDETPTPVASPVGTTLLLGESMTLAEAQSRVGYVIQVPAALGPPDEVYLRQLAAGPMVTLLYRPRPDLPEAEETGVGALLMQFPATSDIEQIIKRVTMGTGSVIGVPVNGADGFWVMGSSELVISQDPSAGPSNGQSPLGRCPDLGAKRYGLPPRSQPPDERRHHHRRVDTATHLDPFSSVADGSFP